MQHILSRIQTVLNTISLIEAHRSKIAWLSQLEFDYSRIANLGCNIGHETIALLWYLGATEVIGIDINHDSIDQAQSTIKYFQDDIEAIKRDLPYSHDIPDDIRNAANNFIEQYESYPLPYYIAADITKETAFPSNYFKLIYCERVLYHIACDESESETDNMLLAMQEIARITKPGGLVVAIEPKTCSSENNTFVNLHHDFSRAGLLKVENLEIPMSFANKEIYLYSKPE